jgi:hypothetical protein
VLVDSICNDSCAQVRHNKALLAHMLAVNKATTGKGAQHLNSASQLASALAELLPSDLDAIAALSESLVTPVATCATASPSKSHVQPAEPAVAAVPACVPAQINLATLLVAHGHPTEAMQLVAPVVAAASSLPSGSAVHAYIVLAEAQLAVRQFQVCQPKRWCLALWACHTRCFANHSWSSTCQVLILKMPISL